MTNLLEMAPSDDRSTDAEKPAKQSTHCKREDCYTQLNAKRKHDGEYCMKHQPRDVSQMAEYLYGANRIQLLAIPFLGWVSTFPEDVDPLRPYNYVALDALEELGLIAPIVVPENNNRWAYALTEKGREVVVLIRSGVTHVRSSRKRSATI